MSDTLFDANVPWLSTLIICERRGDSCILQVVIMFAAITKFL